MLRSIQFDNQSGRCTVKVHNKSADNPLFVNLHRILAEEQIPELPLMGRHLSAQPAGILQLIVIFWYAHDVPLSVGYAASSPKGRAKTVKQTWFAFSLLL